MYHESVVRKLAMADVDVGRFVGTVAMILGMLRPVAVAVPGELVRCQGSAQCHIVTEAKQQFANHTFKAPFNIRTRKGQQIRIADYAHGRAI